MKKNTFRLLTTLSFLTLASYAGYGVVNSVAAFSQQENTSFGLLSQNQNILVAVTPEGAIPDKNEITLHKGDELTIQGKVTPSLGYKFDNIKVSTDEYSNIPVINEMTVLKLEGSDTQTDSNFVFRYKAQQKGSSNVKLTATWKTGNNEQKVDSSIKVNVED